jgi:hypothetical protein
MAVTLEAAARNAACNAVVDLLDGGTIEFQTSGNAEVATLGLGTPAFGNASTGTATANAITSDTDATGNASPITKAVFKTSASAALFTVSVTATGGGGDIQLSSVNISPGDTVSVSSYTHTQPA